MVDDAWISISGHIMRWDGLMRYENHDDGLISQMC